MANFGSNMDKLKRWVKNELKKINPMAGFVHIKTTQHFLVCVVC